MKRITAAAFFLFVAAIAGCGGGGGGGTSTTGGSSLAVISNVSPQVASAIATQAPTVTFNTDVNATCRWSLSNAGYDSMTSTCSGAMSKSHSCTVQNLSEGGDSLFISCMTQAGVKDTSSTNKVVYYVVDITAPGVYIDFPADETELLNTELPSRIEISYSDENSGLEPSSIDVSFTFKSRTLSLSDLFGKDPVANAGSSRTDASNTNPMSRTSVSRFADTTFSAAAAGWTFARNGASSLRVTAVGTNEFVVWDTAGTSAKLIDTSDNGETDFTFPANPLSVTVSDASGKLYAIFDSDTNLYIYDLAAPASFSTYNLTGTPFTLSYNETLDRVYVSYTDVERPGVWNCSSGAMRKTKLSPDNIQSLAAAVPGETDSIVSVAVSGGVRLYLEGSGGTTIDVYLGLQLPRDLLVDSAGTYAYVSMSTLDKVSAVNLATGAKTDIDVGSEPKTLIEGPAGTLLCMNTGDGTISVIDTGTMAVSSSPSPGTLFTDGVYLSGPGAYFIAEDLWDVGYIQDRTPAVISASIEDAAGNSGSAQSTVYVSVDAP